MDELAKKYIEKHIQSDLIIESVKMTTDYKTNNREAKKLQKLFMELSQNIPLAQKVYKELLQTDIVTTKAISAAECLRLGILQKQALRILRELAARKDIGIISFEAEMTLNMWEKSSK